MASSKIMNNTELKRNLPICGKLKIYTSLRSYQKAIKKNTLCNTCYDLVIEIQKKRTLANYRCGYNWLLHSYQETQ